MNSSLIKRIIPQGLIPAMNEYAEKYSDFVSKLHVFTVYIPAVCRFNFACLSFSVRHVRCSPSPSVCVNGLKLKDIVV